MATQPGATSSTRSRAATPTRWWLVPIVVLMLLCYVVPYTVLRDVDAWYGSFLFWSLVTAAVIAINAVVAMKWRD